MLTDATIALYYLKGLETGLLSLDEVRAWADGAIAALDAPDPAFIDVALSKDVPDAVSALHAFAGEGDGSDVGAWLLTLLQQADVQSWERLSVVIRRAMLVSKHCGMDDGAYYEFVGIDDKLDLTRNEQYGTVDDCRTDFRVALQRHARPFPDALGLP